MNRQTLSPQAGIRPGFSRDMTDADLSTHLQPVTATGGIHVNFFWKKVKITSKDAAVDGTVQTRLCVSKQPKGDRSTVAVRYITEEQAAKQFPHEFAMFQQYSEVPTQGTSLDELPGISMSQIGMLVLNGLRSIEDLLEVSEDQVAQLGLDATRAQKTAQVWAARRDGSADVISAADVEARYERQTQSLQAQIDAITARNKELEAQNVALQSIQAGGQAPVGNAAEPVGVNGDEELEYDISNMPDTFSEGPATTDGMDLVNEDPDPLAGD